MSRKKRPEDQEDLEVEDFEDVDQENLIPGSWLPYSKPDLVNKAHRWATRTSEMVPVKDQHKGRTVGLVAVLVGCLAYVSLLIFGLAHYPGVMAISFLILLIAVWRVLRD